jgi:glucose/arabinose dehydrogenase
MKSRNHPLAVCAAAAAAAGAVLTPLHAEFPPLQLEPVAIAQFFSPTTVTHAGDGSDRLFITDQRGRIFMLMDGMVLPETFLDLGPKLVTERANFDERGLLGLVFHPDYAASGAPGEGLFYTYYSAPSPDAPGTTADPVDHRSVIAEFRVSPGDPNRADPASERILLTFNQPQFNHNGGQLAFGPDNLLYIASGDGGGANDNAAGHTGGGSGNPSGVLGNSQDLTRLLGKLLRIDPLGSDAPGGQYGIPPDNPFVGAGAGVRPEIFAYGLRNPWRFSFDRGPGGTNRLFLADVGQGLAEEVNLVTAGGNYGWRRFEGPLDFDATTPSTGPYIAPIAAYTRPGRGDQTGLMEIGISVTGGYVYRGSTLPDLHGKYIFGDWSTSFNNPNGTMLGLEETVPGVFTLNILEILGGNPIGHTIQVFGVDEAGEIYVGTRSVAGAPSATEPGTGNPSGQLFKLVPAAAPVQVELTPARDNTIYSDYPNNSNGAGDLFAGRTMQAGIRRALLKFDLASIPADAEILSATLSLTVSQTTTGSFDFSLHRIERDWGEAGSVGLGQGAPAQAGEATWLAAFFGGEAWATPGGDFVSAPSASASVGASGSYSWSSGGLAADVAQWAANPGANHGWILRGNETNPSAKRIHSRESAEAAARPRLTVTYQADTTLTRRQVWERTHFQVGQFIDPLVDLDGDRIPTLLEYAWDLNPHSPDEIPPHYDVSFDQTTGSANVMFRRDPRAIDLRYALEISSDLRTWTSVAVSEAGNIPTGGASIGEDVDPEAPETRLVHAVVTADPEMERLFVRLQVNRP